MTKNLLRMNELQARKNPRKIRRETCVIFLERKLIKPQEK